ncbi:hypothetical protein TcWFU_009345 [Taenia crassiceps]|uniref:Uncharacterized protein n=1 Tax=Taenia crassiceps TaxID=6207 RepID=A0ABR4Q3D8_9CEST
MGLGTGTQRSSFNGHLSIAKVDNQYVCHVTARMTCLLPRFTALLVLLCWHLVESGKFLHQICIYDKIRYNDSRDAYFFYTNPKPPNTLDVELTREVFEGRTSLEVERLECTLQKHFIREEHRLWILCCK